MRSGSSVPDGRQPPRARDHPGADDQSVEPAPAADADVCDGALDADLQRLHTLDPASVLALVGRWILRFRRHGNQRFRLASAHPVQFQMEHVVAQNPAGGEFIEERDDGPRGAHQQRSAGVAVESDSAKHRALHLPGGGLLRRPAAQIIALLHAALDTTADTQRPLAAA